VTHQPHPGPDFLGWGNTPYPFAAQTYIITRRDALDPLHPLPVSSRPTHRSMGDGHHSKAGGGEDSTPTPNGAHENGHAHGNGNGHAAPASWRPARAHLTVDDGLSTESEAESSYHGWSDAGW
jgi:hypothetical protein